MISKLLRCCLIPFANWEKHCIISTLAFCRDKAARGDVLECVGGAPQLLGDTCRKHMLLRRDCGGGGGVVLLSLPAAAQRIRYVTLAHTCLGPVAEN